MDTAQLITLYFERSTALQNYWTLFVVVIGGLLAFSSLRQRPNRLTTVLVTVLFCCFAYKNCGAIGDVTHQRLAVLKSIDDRVHLEQLRADAGQGPAPEVAKALRPTLDVPAWPGVRNFHIASDVLTVLTLWSMEWRRRVHERERAAVVG